MQTEQQVDERRFASARLTDQADGAPLPDPQVHVRDRGGSGVGVREADVSQFYFVKGLRTLARLGFDSGLPSAHRARRAQLLDQPQVVVQAREREGGVM